MSQGWPLDFMTVDWWGVFIWFFVFPMVLIGMIIFAGRDLDE